MLQYRSAMPVPRDLHEHCVIYLEEGLYSQALSQLNNLVVSGTATSTSSLPSEDYDEQPAFTPSPSILALLSTLAVHPAMTTRSNSEEKLCASNASLHLLGSVNSIVGPVNCDFSSAFTFVEKRRGATGRHSATHLRQTETRAQISDSELPKKGTSGSDEDTDESTASITSIYAQNDSLWACAEDFWHVVGWSFNCAARFPERWERWRLWLQLMLEIIEDDWQERSRLHQEQESLGNGPSGRTLVNSVASCFLAGYRGDSNRPARRRLVRAVFANATDKDLAEFREIFKGETKKKRKKAQPVFKVARDVNIDAGEFGDYYDDLGSDEADLFEAEGGNMEGIDDQQDKSSIEPAPARKPGRPKRQTPSPDEKHTIFSASFEGYGGYDAMNLRRRLLIVMSRVALALPKQFTELSDFVDMLEEYIRPLPLSVYSFLLSPIQDIQGSRGIVSWPPEALSSLLQELARQLVPPSAPRNRDNYLTQQVLEKHYLPFPARLSSPVENAKLSIILENMIRLLRSSHIDVTSHNGRLRRPLETGIKERNLKAQNNKSKAGSDGTSVEAQEWLEMSSTRLRMLLLMIEESP